VEMVIILLEEISQPIIESELWIMIMISIILSTVQCISLIKVDGGSTSVLILILMHQSLIIIGLALQKLWK